MPMTRRQLDQVQADYERFVPRHWRVVMCETRYAQDGDRHVAERCALCGCSFLEAEATKEITWESRRDLNSYLRLRTLKARVCRNGVACRRRATPASSTPAAA